MHPDTIRQFQRAVTLQQQGRLDDAASLCQAVVDRAPREPDPLHLMGLIRKQQGRLEDALCLRRDSIDKAPDRPNFLGNLGNLLTELQRYPDAEHAYRRALALDASFRPTSISAPAMTSVTYSAET